VIDEKSPVFEFDTGKSRFRAIELPPSAEAKRLVPELVGVGVPGTATTTVTVPVASGVFVPFTDTPQDLNYGTYFGKLGLLLQ
jgi:hypothetical protein